MIPLSILGKALFWFFAFSSIGYAQLSRDLTDLQKRYREARADALTYLHTRSVAVNGQVEQGGAALNFELIQRESGEIRYTLNTPEGLVIQVFDGKDGWRWVSGKPSLGVTRLTDKQLRFFRLNNAFYSPFELPESYAFTPKYLGVEAKDGGSPEHHVQLVSTRFGDVLDIWIDANNFLETRRHYRPSLEATPLVMVFNEYQEADGFRAPFKVTTSFQGDTLATAQVDEVSRNSGMLSFYFTKPSSYKVVANPR
ncbi:hypothetical protein [Cerasicoccus frondis]|uniref:hypothetical protein n=1 Tax=Cerasicoccus frondis TaxID=490090 RepID=UPI002852771F|nr:hypothetical protein [Cerasicoccus frondis]